MRSNLMLVSLRAQFPPKKLHLSAGLQLPWMNQMSLPLRMDQLSSWAPVCKTASLQLLDSRIVWTRGALKYRTAFDSELLHHKSGLHWWVELLMWWLISNFNLSTGKIILASFLAKPANLILANISNYTVHPIIKGRGLSLVFITITKHKEELL